MFDLQGHRYSERNAFYGSYPANSALCPPS
jgi:hypothetical protein